MNLTKCSNGHFYDADRYDSCPHCNGSGSNQVLTVTENFSGGLGQDTIADIDVVKKENTSSLEDVIKNANNSTVSSITDDQKTIGFFSTGTPDTLEPVVGWLVCIKGKHYGEDFRLITGRNFVGRSPAMEVCLSGDNFISREKHLIIVFEPKQNTFIVQPGDSKELSYLNDNVILQTLELKAYDVLSMGNSKFLFVPFCTEDNNWSKYENEE